MHGPTPQEYRMTHRPALFAALLLATSAAWGHAHVKASTPANGSTLAAAPAQLAITFNEAAQVTALSLQLDGAAPVPLAPLPKAPARELAMPLPALAAGHYVVKWRAVGDDGHVTAGTLQFTVAGGKSP
jgi:methionine-rich copper-binding protein CopC